MQDPNQLPPQGGQYIPPQPTHISPDGRWFWDGAKWAPRYQATADIPPDSPYHSSAAPSRRTSGGVGAGLLAALAAAWAYGKYALLVALKFPAFATLLSGLLAVGAYALLFPWQVAVGIVVLIFIHEMGHVVAVWLFVPEGSGRQKFFDSQVPHRIQQLGGSSNLTLNSRLQDQ